MFILGISMGVLFDELLGRTYGRLVDLFSGEDTAGLVRSTATWSPALSLLSSAPNAKILFEMGVNEHLLFLKIFRRSP